MPRPTLQAALSRCALFFPTLAALATTVATTACTVTYHSVDNPAELPQAKVRPGISVLLSDSSYLIRGKKLLLLTNQTGINEKRVPTIDLLRTDTAAMRVNVQVVGLLAPEHGLSGNADHPNLPSGIDSATHLPLFSLYGSATAPPPDSAFKNADAVLIDLQDVGTRTWTYEGAMLYTMRAAARAGKMVIIADRPNPITGSVVEGPILDSATANSADPSPEHPGLAYALYPMPLRHGMTMGELAKLFNAELKINANLHVIPAAGWHREVWFDRTGLPFVDPSPNLTTFQSVMLYPALVPFEATNLSVGRGSLTPFQIIGAPWLKPAEVIQYLKDNEAIHGVRLMAEDFTPYSAGDKKYNGQLLHGIRITVTDRSALQTTRLFANLFSAIHRLHPNDLTVDTLQMDRLFGSDADRKALMSSQDPDAVVDREYGPAYAFRERVKRYLMY